MSPSQSKTFDVVIMFDGLCEPKNPGGFGCYGYLIWLGGKKKLTDSGCLGQNVPDVLGGGGMTNNYAEYCALGFALKRLIELDIEVKSLTILGDSQLVINQINKDWQIKSDTLKPLAKKCHEYLDRIGQRNQTWVARWVPREINHEADALSNVGYEQRGQSS